MSSTLEKNRIKKNVFDAIQRGDIKRPKAFQKCGAKGVKLEAHHSNDSN